MAIDTFHQGLLQRFAEEAAEQVQQFNQRLLMLEQESASTKLIAEMARGMHSLKSLAKMLGIEDVARFSNVVKGVLEDMTSGKIQPRPGVIAALLESSDKLREYIEATVKEENTVDLAPVIRKLKRTIESYKPVEEKPTPVTASLTTESARVLTDAQKNILADRIKSGFNVFQISCYFHKATFMNEIEAVQKEMAKNGEVISMMGSAESPPPGFDLHFKFILASHLKQTALSNNLHIAPIQIQQLEWYAAHRQEFDRSKASEASEDVFVAELLKTESLVDDSKRSQKARKIFFEDFSEKIQRMSKEILELEKNSESETHINELFRICHNLKGSGTTFGYPVISAMAHYLETILDRVRRKEKEVSPEVIDVLLMSADALQDILYGAKSGHFKKEKYSGILNRLGRFASSWKLRTLKPLEEAKQVEIQPLQPLPETAKKTFTPLEEGIRVGLEKLDKFMNTVDELTVNKNLDAQTLRRLEKAVYTGRKLLREWHTLHRTLEQSLQKATGTMPFGLTPFRITQDLNKFSAKMAEVIDRVGEVFKTFQRSLSTEGCLVDELHSEMLKMRMLPLETIFEIYHRTVRDIAREHGKEVILHTSGGELEVDRKILERLNDSLTHLIRNAVDHGIEPPEKREEIGKPRAGTITLRAQQLGSQAIIDVEDDGQGIDPELLKTTAIAKGFLSKEEAGEMSQEELFQLIFRLGFTTSKQVTELSGRGIGMDVVSSQINSLGGSIDTWSVKGVGTKFSLRIPLTLALTKVLLVEVNTSLFSIPISDVESVHQFSYSQVKIVHGKRVLVLNNLILPLLELGTLLGLDTPFDLMRDQHRRYIMILNYGGKLIAVLVDNLVDEFEVMTKGLGPMLKKVRKVAGVNILADGRLSLLVNTSELFDMAQRIGLKAPIRPKKSIENVKKPIVLVVEDSSIERELICSLLSVSGYQAEAAANGYEALLYLRKYPCNLIVTDIEMPNINGFEFIRILRGDEQLHNIPVIIMTVKDTERDRKRGLAVGADAYIVKGAFDQQNLLRTVRNLLGNAHHRSYVL